jgi:hypothetical protein
VISKEGVMNVKIIVEINGREGGVVEKTVCGSALEIEEQVQELKQRVGRIVLEYGFEEAERSAERPECCGRKMNNRGRRTITVTSLSGEVPVERTRYRCRQCGRESTPGDEAVCCGSHRLTKALAKRVCQLATLEHYTRLEQLLADQHGVHLGHEEMAQVVHDVGGAADRERRRDAQAWRECPTSQRVWPEAEVTPQRIYVSCDGIMYCTNQVEPDPQNPGTNRLIWQQMRVGCVYWQDSREQWHKQVLWGRESPQDFGVALYRLACRCGYRQAQEKIFAADGGDWCWDIHQRYFSDATGILDWFHVSEHLWATAHVLHPETNAAKSWVEEASGVLRYRGGSGLVDWLADQLPGLRRAKRQSLIKLQGYLQPRIWQMDYPRYRAANWQIGTGMIESTAKQLVALRLKGPGMHWTEAGAVAVTALRAHNLNDHWHSFWKNLQLTS